MQKLYGRNAISAIVYNESQKHIYYFLSFVALDEVCNASKAKSKLSVNHVDFFLIPEICKRWFFCHRFIYLRIRMTLYWFQNHEFFEYFMQWKWSQILYAQAHVKSYFVSIYYLFKFCFVCFAEFFFCAFVSKRETKAHGNQCLYQSNCI